MKLKHQDVEGIQGITSSVLKSATFEARPIRSLLSLHSQPTCLFVAFDWLISSKFDCSKRSNTRSDVRSDFRVFFRRSKTEDVRYFLSFHKEFKYLIPIVFDNILVPV